MQSVLIIGLVTFHWKKWSKTLLTRADSALWRQDVEFVASMYNVRLRRDQIRAVEMCVAATRFSAQEQQELGSLTAAGLVAHAVASGEVDSVRQVLRRKGLMTPLRTAFQRMQIIQRSVCWSESAKDGL